MVARTALQLNPGQPGPRPLNPMRDLAEVADVMEVAFADELDAGGRQLIREARAIGRTGPFALLLSLFSEASGGLTPGFVWEEDGRIVGNVTVAPSKKRPGSWYAANVAVLPHYRRRGIATELMKTVIQHVQQRNGRTLNLQVRGNSPALKLYQKLDFQAKGAITRWRLDSRKQLNRVATRGISPRPAKQREWFQMWQLFHTANPAAHGWPDSLTIQDFRPSFWRQLSKLLAGTSMRRWVASRTLGESVEGYIELRIRPRLGSQMTLRVRPEAAGSLEGDLLRTALHHRLDLGRLCLPIITDHPAADQAAEQRFREAGFRPLRTLHLMQQEIKTDTHCRD